MTDISHIFGNDLQVSSTGDIAIASGTEEGQQRLYRRLLTNPGGYSWNVLYGAGLPAYVGSTASAAQIAAVTRSNMRLEEIVSQNPPPVVSVNPSQNDIVSITVKYVDSNDGNTYLLDLPMGDN